MGLARLLAVATTTFVLTAACTSGDEERDVSPTSSAATTTPSPTATTPSTPRATATASIEPTRTAVPTPFDLGSLPPTTRLGDPAVDRLLEAILEGDVDTLLEAVMWVEMPCGGGGFGPPSPPDCDDGIETGTLVRAVLYGDGGEGAYASESRARHFFETFADRADGPDYRLCELGSDVVKFRGVVGSSESPGSGFMRDITIRVRDGQIASFSYFNETRRIEDLKCRGVIR